MSALIQKLVVFVVLLVVGYAGARKGMLPREFTVAGNKLVLNVFMVASILNSVMSNPPQMSGRALLAAVAVMSGVMVFSYAAAAVIVRVFRLKGERAPLFEMLVSVMNPMFIGIPVAEALYGGEAVFYVALVNLSFNLILFSYGVWRMKAKPGEKASLSLKDVLTAPMIATLLSILIFVLHLPIPGMISSLVSTMSGATMPLSMVIIGSSLGGVQVKDAFNEGSLYVVAGLRLLVLPGLTWLVLRLLPIDPLLYAAALITAACPSGIMVGVLALQYGRDATYCSKGIMLNTLLSMVTIPLLVKLLL